MKKTLHCLISHPNSSPIPAVCVCLAASLLLMNDLFSLACQAGYSLQFLLTQSRTPSLVASGKANNEIYKALCHRVWPLHV